MSRGWLYGLTAAFCTLILAGALFINLKHNLVPDRRTVFGADEVDFYLEVQAALQAENFDALDRMGRDLATLQDRFVGGAEKLGGFYESTGKDGCTSIFCEARPVQPDHIRKLQNWLNRDPRNPVAKTAMALNWYYYGWKGRGCADWADITFDQWQVFFDRLRIARSYLDGVDPHADPYYYVLLTNILRESGGPRERIDALYDQGHTAHPSFFALTGAYALSLDRSWFGRAGDVGWLAEAVLNDPGGDAGRVSYSFVAEQSAPLVATERFFADTGLTWGKVKQAFAVRRQLYGLSVHDWNAYCYIAYAARDRAAGREAHGNFGPNVDPTVWRDQTFYFNSVLPWIAEQ